MRVITIASPKGGTGKSTVTSALAVRATQDSLRVAIIDLNVDQGSLTKWWILRGEPMNPRLFPDPSDLIGDVELLRKDGWDWVFIDTPPTVSDLVELAILVADAVIVPVRASIFDFGSVEPIVEMCKQRRKPFAFLLSAADSKFKKLTDTAVAALAREGPLLGARVSYRLPYINALTIGKTGPEVEKDLAPEIDAIWSEVKRLASSNSRIAEKGRTHV